MVNLEEQIKILVELQGLDTQIFRLELILQEIPAELKMLEAEFQEKTAIVKACEGAVKSFLLKRKEKEMDLETKETLIKKLRAQQYQVKTNKEYSALQQEIERSKADGSILEDEIIKILDEIDAANQKLSEAKERVRLEEQSLKQKKDQRQAETKKTESELEGLQDQRKAIAEKVDKNILLHYDRLLKSREGLAIVPVRQDACQACFRVLPPQVINEVKLMKDLTSCEYCTRILYSED